jgi:hypothetical protein
MQLRQEAAVQVQSGLALSLVLALAPITEVGLHKYMDQTALTEVVVVEDLIMVANRDLMVVKQATHMAVVAVEELVY